MLTSLFWCVGMALEALLILRALRVHTFFRYPFFFTYLTTVALLDFVRYIAYLYYNNAYDDLYWPTQFLTLIVGYGVILEILGRALVSYPGAERMARYLVIATFCVIFAYVGTKAMSANQWSPTTVHAELERDLRAVQAAVIACIVGVIAYFRIAIGRNLKGLILGYGLFVVTSVATLAIRAYTGFSSNHFWKIVQPLCYLIVLLIWLYSLWSYHPNPVVSRAQENTDYDSFARTTEGALEAVRTNLARIGRSG